MSVKGTASYKINHATLIFRTHTPLRMIEASFSIKSSFPSAESEVRAANRVCGSGNTESTRRLQRRGPHRQRAERSTWQPCVRRSAHSTVTSHPEAATTTSGDACGSGSGCQRNQSASNSPGRSTVSQRLHRVRGVCGMCGSETCRARGW